MTFKAHTHKKPSEGKLCKLKTQNPDESSRAAEYRTAGPLRKAGSGSMCLPAQPFCRLRWEGQGLQVRSHVKTNKNKNLVIYF